jgi:dTDP-4-amino-4,6-dideoxygalactose transaminase
MKIPFFSFEGVPTEVSQMWDTAIKSVINDGKFVLGEHVEEFERKWARYLGVNFAVGVGNGFDALVISLKTLGIGPGDLVAVPSHTFIATWLAIDAIGATPIGIDCCENGLMNLEILETSKLRFAAVVPVHMHGQLVHMDRLMTWANKNEVFVVEDCAQAHGANTSGKKAGSWGHISAYSFYPTKNLGALGDAGAVVTDNAEYAEKASRLANYGSSRSKKYEFIDTGINSRMDSIQASILTHNLVNLDHWNARRRGIAKEYDKFSQDLGIRYLRATEDSVYHHYIVFSKKRDLTRNLLSKLNVVTEIHYPETAERTYMRIKYDKHDFNSSSTAEKFCSEALSLPIYPWMTEESLSYVIRCLQNSEVLDSFF